MVQPSRSIGFIAYDDADLLDISGPLQIFATATEQLRDTGLHRAAYHVAIVSIAGGTVTTSSSVSFLTSALPPHGGRFDTLIVAGGRGAIALLADANLIDWLRAGASRWRRTASVCAGSLLLAEAGLLDGRRVATHWDHYERIRRDWPKVRVVPDSVFLNDGAIWTSAGVGSGMDMALAMVEADWGRRTAQLVAKRLVVRPMRSDYPSRLSVPLRPRRATDRCAEPAF